MCLIGLYQVNGICIRIMEATVLHYIYNILWPKGLSINDVTFGGRVGVSQKVTKSGGRGHQVKSREFTELFHSV